MANMSEATGILNIHVKNKDLEQVKKLFTDLNELTSQWYYSTTFALESLTQVSEELYTINFYGYGRWGYFVNVEWFAKDKEINKIYLNNDINDMRLIFLYNDVDPMVDSYYIYATNIIDISCVISDLGNKYYKNMIYEIETGTAIRLRNGDENIIEEKEMRYYYFPYESFTEDEEDDVIVEKSPNKIIYEGFVDTLLNNDEEEQVEKKEEEKEEEKQN